MNREQYDILYNAYSDMATFILEQLWGGHEASCARFPMRSAGNSYTVSPLPDSIECTCVLSSITKGNDVLRNLHKLPDYAGMMMQLQAKLEAEQETRKAIAFALGIEGGDYKQAILDLKAQLEQAQRDIGDAALAGHLMGVESMRYKLEAAEAQVATLRQRISELEYIVAVNVDPGECGDETAAIVRSCHHHLYPENYSHP